MDDPKENVTPAASPDEPKPILGRPVHRTSHPAQDQQIEVVAAANDAAQTQSQLSTATLEAPYTNGAGTNGDGEASAELAGTSSYALTSESSGLLAAPAVAVAQEAAVESKPQALPAWRRVLAGVLA